MNIDVKGIIAILIVIGCFILVGTYVLRGAVPDVAIMGLVGTALGMVLGFYFGHLNGTQTALANNAVFLAQQALNKQTTDSIPPINGAAPIIAPIPPGS